MNICEDQHAVMRVSVEAFERLTRNQKIQNDYDGTPLLILAQCLACSTTVSWPASDEARRRLEQYETEST